MFTDFSHSNQSDMTELLHFHCSLSCIEEGNGNPLQCSCLENPRDGVTQSQTRLNWLSSSSKECSDYCAIALISHASKVMLKILQARLQQSGNWELPDVQAGFRKGWGARDQIAICWIIEKAREFQKKHLFLPYWLCQSLWLCGSQ